jgi:hypothetical protein
LYSPSDTFYWDETARIGVAYLKMVVYERKAVRLRRAAETATLERTSWIPRRFPSSTHGEETTFFVWVVGNSQGQENALV